MSGETAGGPRANPPTPGVLEEAQVRAMFDRIAGLYDRMNSVMTAGLHHEWRRRAADLAHLSPGDRALDVATGTGDLALELAARVGPTGEVVASDFSEGMLVRASAKASAAGLGHVRVEAANALALPYRDGEFAAATVGFGARNFADLDGGLREMARVVHPGGRVVVLEITTPRRPPLSTFFGLWFDRLVPALGRLAGAAQAYSYLPSSVRRFPGPEELAHRMWALGLRDVSYVLTAGGIIALHVGTVPAGMAADSTASSAASRPAEAGALASAASPPAAADAPAPGSPAEHSRAGSKTTRPGASRGGSSTTRSFSAIRSSRGSSTSWGGVRRGSPASWGSWGRGEGRGEDPSGAQGSPPGAGPEDTPRGPGREGSPPGAGRDGSPPGAGPEGTSAPEGSP